MIEPHTHRLRLSLSLSHTHLFSSDVTSLPWFLHLQRAHYRITLGSVNIDGGELNVFQELLVNQKVSRDHPHRTFKTLKK